MTHLNRKPYAGWIYLTEITGAHPSQGGAAARETMMRILRECCRPNQRGPGIVPHLSEAGPRTEEQATQALDRLFEQIDHRNCRLVIALVDSAAMSSFIDRMQTYRKETPLLRIVNAPVQGSHILSEVPCSHQDVVLNTTRQDWEEHLAFDLKVALEKLLPPDAAVQ